MMMMMIDDDDDDDERETQSFQKRSHINNIIFILSRPRHKRKLQPRFSNVIEPGSTTELNSDSQRDGGGGGEGG